MKIKKMIMFAAKINLYKRYYSSCPILNTNLNQSFAFQLPQLLILLKHSIPLNILAERKEQIAEIRSFFSTAAQLPVATRTLKSSL